MKRDPLILTRAVLERQYLNFHTANGVKFWIGPEWQWLDADVYLNRLQNIELFTGEKLDWKQHAPLGLLYIYDDQGVGYRFNIPIEFRQSMFAHANSLSINQIKQDAHRIRTLWEACIYSGFQPIFLISPSEFPEAIIVPTEADAVMISALWSADD